MIDLHNHLLPGIDDGARKLDETLEFLRIARRDGVRTVVATPHMKPGVYDNTRETILERVSLVREAQKGDEAEGVALLPGAEVYYTADLTARLRDGQLMTLGDGGRYLLLELPYQQVPIGVEETIFQLKLCQVTPLMAHPERVASSIRLGALTQVTGASITGQFGKKAQGFALRMLERNMIHVLASDSHDVSYRPPRLTGAVAAAAAVVGEEAAQRLVEDNPAAILAGRPLPVEDQAPPLRPKGLMGRFRALLGRR